MRMLRKKRLLVFGFVAHVATARVLAGCVLQSFACLLACVFGTFPLRGVYLAALLGVLFFTVLTWLREWRRRFASNSL